MHPNDTGATAAGLAASEHGRVRAERVAGIDRDAEAHVGVAQVRDCVQRDVGNGLPEDGVEDEQVIDGLALEAEGPGELGVTVERVAIRREGDVEGLVTFGDGPGHAVLDLEACREVLEVVPDRRLVCH